MELLSVLALVGLAWAAARVVCELGDPARDEWWRFGVVVRRADALDEHTELIGHYMGREIWREVRFKGMAFAFDHVAAAAERDAVRGGELFLEPGIVYVRQPPVQH